MDEAFRVGARRGADRHEVGRRGAGVAERPLADRGAELVEEGVAHVETVQDALGAEVAVREDRLRPVLGDDLAEATGDLVERLVPGDPLEPAAALGAGSPERVQDAVRVVDAGDVVVHLHAEPAPGERVLGVATDLDGPSVLDGDEHRARVRAVVRTRAPDDRLACGCAGHRRPPSVELETARTDGKTRATSGTGAEPPQGAARHALNGRAAPEIGEVERDAPGSGRRDVSRTFPRVCP
jgi:hypothetical protein